MSIALGWLAVVLSGLAGTAGPRSDGPQITYQFQIIEVRGLLWREAATHGLEPVTSRGGVTVWTAPRDFLKSLPEGTVKETLMAPRLTAFSQAAAQITTRKNHPFVTQVAWRGEGGAPRETTETVREGMAATIAGRCIDQGVLVQLVIEDTDIRSVHTLNLSSPAQASRASAKATAAGCCAASTAQEPICGKASCPATTQTQAAKSGAGCDPTCPAPGHSRAKDAETRKAAWHASSDQGCCADDETNAAECHAAKAADSESCQPGKSTWTPTRSAQVQLPEIGSAEIAGEWLIPRDEVLLVGFGPHTVADKDGKAVVRERLAMITADEVTLPTASNDPERLVLPRALPKVARPPASGPTSIPTPAMPSRSLPQGIHADGTPAELPPLPDDEKADQAPSDSSQPQPSPQTKKSQHSPSPASNQTAKPTASMDSKTTKAAIAFPKGLFKQTVLPQIWIPNLQFIMPLKPFAMKLPFNQKLELELIGRIVPDPEAASGSTEAEE